MKAARSGKLWAVKRLIAAGANVNLKDRNEEMALHFSCRQGSTDITNMLIKVGFSDSSIKIPIIINLTTKHAKASGLRPELTSTLGPQGNSHQDRDFLIKKHPRFQPGRPEAMLEKKSAKRWARLAGARMNVANQIGLTPLMEAVSYNQRDAVKLLVNQRTLDLFKRDYTTGDTALHIAVKKNYIQIVEILLQAGNFC
ncbi:unnamed protein product [Protopolystoma xenopodis]|uniref:Uncharacterized protein n=1 Tax=Protopolystoma xenopodis TaxID=117903 RepID=A0A3S5CNI4_9PLAT|nr:unnamed protein product [Protopolystoma xenopodis]